MKASILSIALAIICLLSCSEDPEPTYTSMVGKWKFAIKTVPITGSFEISEIADVLTIDNKFGEFKMNGATHKIDERHAISLGNTPQSFNRFWLHSAADDIEVAFDDAEYSADFRTITAKNFYYRDGDDTSTLFEETVVITRY